MRNQTARHDRAAHRSSPAAKTLSTIVVLHAEWCNCLVVSHAAWCNCLVSIACSVCVCVWSHACDNSYTRCTSMTSDRTRCLKRKTETWGPWELTERSGHVSVTIYVSGSAGFCCWGLVKGRPFPHVKAWGGTAQITTQGHRGTCFRVVFR